MQRTEVEVLPPGSIYMTRDRLAGCLAGLLEGAILAGFLPAGAGPAAIEGFLEKAVSPFAEGLVDCLCQGLVVDAPVEAVARRAVAVARLHHAATANQSALVLAALWAHAQLRGHAQAFAFARETLQCLASTLGIPEDISSAAADGRRVPRFEEPGPDVALTSALAVVTAASRDADPMQDTRWTRHAAPLQADLQGSEMAPLAGALLGLRHGLLGFDEATVQAWRDSASPALAALFAASGVALSPATGPARTSQTHPLRIDAVKVASGALIGMTLCPGKQQAAGDTGAWARDVEADADALAAFGPAALVTLLPQEEMAALSVQGLPAALAARGIEWIHAPMVEGRAPGYVPPGASPADWFAGLAAEVMPRLHAHLAAGRNIVIHCKGGLGRTGALAALLLLSLDPSPALTPEAAALLAMAQVRAARCNAIETVAQERAVMAWRSAAGA